jgi:plasmid stability protein
MASALTLHTLDETLSRSLSAYARLHHKSLNQSAKELLASALGIDAPRRTDHSADLERFFGAWDDETANRLRKNLESFEKINEDTWK